jgi:hypothetical protein
MPVLGGTPRQVLRDIDSPVTEIRIANADGSGDHLLASVPSLVVLLATGDDVSDVVLISNFD